MGDLHKKGSSITSAFYQHPQATETYSKTSQTCEMVFSIKAVQVFPLFHLSHYCYHFYY